MNHMVKVVKCFTESDVTRITTCLEEFSKWGFW